MKITKAYLRAHQNDVIFVFGDNYQRKGYGGGAKLRDETNTYGFVTKKRPDNADTSFFKPDEYKPIFEKELKKLEHVISDNPEKMFLISKIGSGLANRYNIFQKIIQPGIKSLKNRYSNIVFLWM